MKEVIFLKALDAMLFPEGLKILFKTMRVLAAKER
jgi:hypothetical protein